MTKKNPLQFAVVREDPQIEMDIVRAFQLERAVLIGSGGCTAFCLKVLQPDLEIALIEPNAAQIDLLKTKIKLLEKGEINRFGIGNNLENSLIEGGNFESLFRQLRLFINEFIVEKAEIEKALTNGSNEFWREIFAHQYWKTAFELFFSDSILIAIFTESAIRHAPKNSYPAYFQRVLERGLTRGDAPRNYFLHHIFLGHYLADKTALPFYLVDLPKNFEFEFFNGFAQDFHNFGGKQLAHFSNIFDWCDDATVGEIAQTAAKNLEKGSIVVFRQLNNNKNYRPLFGSQFRWLPTENIIARDRSLFYEKIEIGEKI